MIIVTVNIAALCGFVNGFFKKIGSMSIVGVEQKQDLTRDAVWCATWHLLSGAGSTMQDSVSEAGKGADTKAYAFENLGFIIAALCIAVGVGTVKRGKDLATPVVDGFRTA